MELIIKNLDKKYSNGVQALNDVSLTIKNGMFGLLVPNGAGKSSLMRTLATLQGADSSSVTLGDINIFATTYPKYAIENYEHNPVDYLLKPISFKHKSNRNNLIFNFSIR
jgi:ABC-type multidrug transport system ATPase subunit